MYARFVFFMIRLYSVIIMEKQETIFENRETVAIDMERKIPSFALKIVFF